MHLAILSLLLIFGGFLEAKMFHCKDISNEWLESEVELFDELILSWNAKRPDCGSYHIYVSVLLEDWSSWVLYGVWGKDEQKGSDEKNDYIVMDQDVLNLKKGKKGRGFKVKIEAVEGALLQNFSSLHVFINQAESSSEFEADDINLDVEGISQFSLDHRRKSDLCSPTSTACVINYLLGNSRVDPAEFAEKAKDQKFDIYGNWVLNVAEASHRLGSSWFCYVCRLSGLNELFSHIHDQRPVVVSVKGPLKDSALPYRSGHLLVVKGYDARKKMVYCMDPAFYPDSDTEVLYEVEEFLQAWGRRGKIAYIFKKDKI